MTTENNKVEMVTIPLSEYKSLQRTQNWMDMLDEAGIDNAEAYSYAYECKERAIAEGRFTEDDFD